VLLPGYLIDKEPDMPTKVFATLLASLAVCSCAAAPRDELPTCNPSRSGFLKESEVTKRGGLQLVGNSLRIRSGNRLEWNGYPVSRVEAEQMLDRAADLEPQPPLLLQWDKSVTCESVEAVRSIVDKHLACASSGNCIAGSGARLFPPPPISRHP
jgi:hypothetical protein